MVTCHFTANRCCETFPVCCETFSVCCETFPTCCETFPDCCETFLVCCEKFPNCYQTFSFNDNGHDKLKGCVTDISQLRPGSKIVENNIMDLKKVLLF